jgi:hypothetical protein
MKRFLRLNSLIVLLFASCSAPYRHLTEQSVNSQSALKFKPVFEKTLYRCVVDGRIIFKKYHLSGLLFFKTLENGTVRAIYQNEMGFTFFDFEWSNGDTAFKINKVMPQLDRPAVIKTLRKDIELLLMLGLDQNTEKVFADDRGKQLFRRLDIGGGYAYYIEEEGRLIRIENAGEKSKVVTITLQGKNNPADMPARALVDHHNANFTIELNKIDSYADE